MVSLLSRHRRSDAASCEVVRYEMAAVTSDRRHILPDADSRRLIADDPRADDGVTVAEARQRRIGLVDPAFGAVSSTFAQHLGAAIDGDVGALARVQRLLNVIAGNPKSLERSGKQIRVIRIQLPEDRQQSFGRQQQLPRWFDRLEAGFEQMRPELV